MNFRTANALLAAALAATIALFVIAANNAPNGEYDLSLSNVLWILPIAHVLVAVQYALLIGWAERLSANQAAIERVLTENLRDPAHRHARIGWDNMWVFNQDYLKSRAGFRPVVALTGLFPGAIGLILIFEIIIVTSKTHVSGNLCITLAYGIILGLVLVAVIASSIAVVLTKHDAAEADYQWLTGSDS